MASCPERPASKPYLIVVVDDHPVVRQGLQLLIEQEPDLRVCGEAEDVGQTLRLIDALHPDLVVVDLSLRGGSGLDLLKTLSARHPDLPTLVLSIHDETLYAERVLQAGGRGYIMKQEAADTLLRAIRQVLDGNIYLSPQMTSRLLLTFTQGRSEPSASPLARLSDRELEIFCLIGQGYRTRQIAEALHISVKTVETHRAHIVDKLHLSGAHDLVRYATQWMTHTE